MEDLEGHYKSKLYDLDKLSLAPLSKLLMGALQTTRIKKIANKESAIYLGDLVDKIFSDFGLKLNFQSAELKSIPKEGAAIVVANHPLGGVDGLILIKLLEQVRPDFRIMSSFLPSSIKAIDDRLILIPHYDHVKQKKLEQSSFIESREYLNEGGLICLFPAGEVSYYDLKFNSIRDKEWRYRALKFIKSSKVPITPVCISSGSSVMFHALGILNPRFKRLKLPSEKSNRKRKEISVRIGGSINVREQNEFDNIYEFGRYLRTRTYLLGNQLSVKSFYRPSLFKKKAKEIGIARDVNSILAEIDLLKKSDQKLYEHKGYMVFWATSSQIPNTLYEVGRLREITFREIGEGTGKNIDLDEYDLYYRHLFIWDDPNTSIVGAYRLGMGKDILDRYGKRGFYISSLFKLKKGFMPFLEESIELGRSFIVKEYQLKPLSLYMLWKGILYFILKHPDYRYLIGPVSISGDFSNYSKYLIISFVKKYFYNHSIAAHVSPKKEYIPSINPSDADIDALNRITKKDIKKLDRIISDIEIGNFRLPALLKKYLGQNARIAAFNVDPKFNNALDGLLIMDMFNIPLDTIEGLSKELKELKDKSVLSKFPGSIQR